MDHPKYRNEPSLRGFTYGIASRLIANMDRETATQRGGIEANQVSKNVRFPLKTWGFD
jgi:hypothetical protein